MTKSNLALIGVIFVLAVLLAFYLGKAASGDVVNEASTESSPTEASAASATRPVAPFTSEERALIRRAEEAWSEYRDGDEAAYDRQSDALDKLLTEGICWGRANEPQVEFEYHRCDLSSLQTQKPAADSDSALCRSGDQEACTRL